MKALAKQAKYHQNKKTKQKIYRLN